MISFIDGKTYAFDFDKILSKCIKDKGPKKKDDLTLVEKEINEDFNGSEMLKAENRHVRELRSYIDQSQSNDTIAYDLFKTLASPLLFGEFLNVVGDDEIYDEEEGKIKKIPSVSISAAAALSFNTMVNEGFLVEVKDSEDNIINI